jgi:hypothetical protein
LANFSYSAELSEQLLQHDIIPVLVKLLQMLMRSSSVQTGKLVNRVRATMNRVLTKQCTAAAVPEQHINAGAVIRHTAL